MQLNMNDNLTDRTKKIKIIILDVDGVMTDGKIIYSGNGEEIKEFDVRDGYGIKLAKRAGLDIAIITGRSSGIIERRAQELGIERVYQKALNKIDAFNDILQSGGYSEDEMAYVGDDLPDLPVMRRVGLSIAVNDAVDEVAEIAHMVTDNCGGRGAVREVIDFILKVQGSWDSIMGRYYT